MHVAIYCILRLVLWLAAVTIAAIPAHSAAGGMRLWIFNDLAFINDAKAFRDGVFVIVPAAALALSTIVDFFASDVNHSGTTRGLALLGLLLNVIALTCGLALFLVIPAHTEVEAAKFGTYSWIIVLSLVVSLATEIGTSWAARVTHGHGNRQPEGGVKTRGIT